MKTVHLMLFVNVILLSAIGGCGGPKVVPVKGIAMYQGKPVANVILHFSSSDGRTSTGMTDEIGHFELQFDRQVKGAAIGTYKVTVAFAPKDPQEEARMASGNMQLDPVRAAIVSKFGDRETTPLTVTITKAETSLEIRLD